MRITLYVLLATLTIYCNSSSVLSLPPSLIAAAAAPATAGWWRHQQQQKHASPLRDVRGFVPAADVAAAAASSAGTINHLLTPQNALRDTPPPPPYDWQNMRSQEEESLHFSGNGNGNGKNIANTYVYADKSANTNNNNQKNNDDIMKHLPQHKLNANNKATRFHQVTHPNMVNGMLAAVGVEDMATHNEQHSHEGGHEGGHDAGGVVVEFKRKLPSENDLNALLANADERLEVQEQEQNENVDAAAQQASRKQQQQPALSSTTTTPHLRAMLMKKFFTPLRYWTTQHCQPPDRNCWRAYHRALNADSSVKTGAVSADEAEVNGNDDDVDADAQSHAFAFGGGDGSGVGVGGVDAFGNANDEAALDNFYNNGEAFADVGNRVDGGRGGRAIDNNYNNNNNYNNDDDEDSNASNDILMLLSGEQDVMKFLSWAMSHLYPYQHFAHFSSSGDGAEYYYPDMFNWKKLNLSGRLEPPLLVDEPRYVTVRRQQLEEEDLQPATHSQYKDTVPFIPPRGRKHNLPDLDALLNRYETFVPNRGKRDKIKDIFKYDELFFPNRGKRQKPTTKNTRTPFNRRQWQRNCDEDEAVEGGMCGGDGSEKAGARQASFLQSTQQRSQNDGSDDSYLTASPAANAVRRLLSALNGKIFQQRTPHHMPRPGRERSRDDGGGGGGGMTLGIGFDKNSDDIASNNYSGTIDGDLAAEGADGKGDDDGDGDNDQNQDDEDEDDDKIVWMPISADNDQSVKSQSIPHLSTMTAARMRRVAGTFGGAARMRRVAGTFGGAARVAANRMRTSSTAAQHQRQLQKQRAALQQQQQFYHNLQQQKQQQQQYEHHSPTKSALRFRGPHSKRIQMQVKRRALEQLPLPLQAANQAQGNNNKNNDLDILPLRKLHEIKQQLQGPAEEYNQPTLTVEHLPFVMLQQHMSMPQAQQPTLQQEQLAGGGSDGGGGFGLGIDGVAIGHYPPGAVGIERLFENI